MKSEYIDGYVLIEDELADGTVIHSLRFRDARGAVHEYTLAGKESEVFIESLATHKRLDGSYRRQHEHFPISDEEMAMRGGLSAPDTADEAMTLLLQAELRAALLSIPAVQAKRYLLRHGFGYSYREIAQMEGCSVHAVKKSLVAARKKLSKILADRVPDWLSPHTYK